MNILKYESPFVFIRDVVLGFLVLVLVLSLAGIVWINLPDSYVTGPEETHYFPPDYIHQVEPGESLWSIARTYYPDRDPREIVFELRKLNNLQDSATIYPNQLLALPPQ